MTTEPSPTPDATRTVKMRDRFHWARLLASVIGLVHVELLLSNEYLVAENRIRAHLPARLRPGRELTYRGHATECGQSALVFA
jgi:hypothetical protein